MPESSDGLFSWNSSCLSGPQFLQPAVCFRDPEIMDISVFCWVQTLHKAVSKQRPRFARKRKCLICNVLYAHMNELTIATEALDGKVPFMKIAGEVGNDEAFPSISRKLRRWRRRVVERFGAYQRSRPAFTSP